MTSIDHNDRSTLYIDRCAHIWGTIITIGLNEISAESKTSASNYYLSFFQDLQHFRRSMDDTANDTVNGMNDTASHVFDK